MEGKFYPAKSNRENESRNRVIYLWEWDRIQQYKEEDDPVWDC